jgi:3-hydroxy-9,10-secoandrosta-1,3,5(10)-triene-9,17-dione monooxygenase
MTATRSKPRNASKTATVPLPKPDLTPEGMIEAAIALRPLLREKQAETEAAGRILEDVNAACDAAGFYRALQPRRFGGYEFDLPTFAKVMIEVARGCPSTGWVVAFTAGHTHIFAKYPLPTQAEAYGATGEFRCPMVSGREASARKVDGGYVVNGFWDYASGIDVSTHFFAQAPIKVEGEDEAKGQAIALLDRDQYDIEHNWQMLGMQGSGSHRVIVKDVFVPEARVVERNLLAPSTAGAQERVFENPMYAGPSGNILMCEIAAVAIGTGYAALDCYEEILRRRTTPRTTKIRAEDREFQVYFGEAMGILDLAKSALVGCSQQFMDACRDDVSGKAPFTPEVTQRIVQVEQQCCKLAGEAVNIMFRTAGSSEAKPGRTMQRYFRDISTLLTHVSLTHDRTFEMLSKLHFGLETGPPDPTSRAG